MLLMKLTSLLSILFTNPGEFHDRLVIKFEGWLDGLWLGRPVYDEKSFNDAASALERNLGIPVAKILRERALAAGLLAMLLVNNLTIIGTGGQFNPAFMITMALAVVPSARTWKQSSNPLAGSETVPRE